MGKMILVTGGARSGKSTFAQQLAMQYDDVAYVATALVLDSEMELRVQKHRADRPQAWTLYEAPNKMADALRDRQHEVFLVDCMTVYLTNTLFAHKMEWDDDVPLSLEEHTALEDAVMREIRAVVDRLKEKNCIVVTNEVGLGLVPPTAMGRVFRDLSGRMNRMLAEAAEEAYFIVSGLPMQLKGKA